ncbi:MAG: AmmeMemoRadiSam system protein B [Candidatus Thorarchaeota archaeon]
MVVRRALHAGTWYAGSKDKLRSQLEQLFSDKQFGPGELPASLNQQDRTIIGGVSPHAGYAYSGNCAAFTYLNLFKEKIPDTVIVLGTDHMGYNKVAILDEGEWETPLGNLEIDSELANNVIGTSKTIVADKSAFFGMLEEEHNIEIQLPFIKFCAGNEDVKILTMKVGVRKNFQILEKIANDIASAIISSNKDIIVIASSDMSHKNVYNETQFIDFKKYDEDVIDAFTAFNPEKTFSAASKTTVCGTQTITTLMLICKKLNASKGKLLQYYTSHDKSESFGYCVGYFSGIIIK